MLSDWNFWFAIITAITAIIALLQTNHQTRLSNKQNLFDRRLRLFMIADGLIALYRNNLVTIDNMERDAPQFANDLQFVWLTNNKYMEQQQSAIYHVLEQPYHKDFISKLDEITSIAMEITFVFSGDEAEYWSKYIICYGKTLYKMYQYQSMINNIHKANRDEPKSLNYYLKIFPEKKQRNELFSALDNLKEAYNKASSEEIRNKIKNQITLK